MGLGGLGLVCRTASQVLGFPAWLETLFVLFGALALVALLACYALKATRYPEAVRAELTNPGTMGFAATCPLALCIVAGGLGPYATGIADALWWIGYALLLATIIVMLLRAVAGGIELAPLGDIEFVFCIAPHHALAASGEPLQDAELVAHRAVAVADTAQRLTPLTVNLLPGQDVLTVPHMRAKLEAQLRGLGCGFLPEPMARPHLEAGHLVRRETARSSLVGTMHYAWRAERGAAGLGRALRWWLQQLESPLTRRALIERHGSAWS